jgi:hypothetical protein
MNEFGRTQRSPRLAIREVLRRLTLVPGRSSDHVVIFSKNPEFSIEITKEDDNNFQLVAGNQITEYAQAENFLDAITQHIPLRQIRRITYNGTEVYQKQRPIKALRRLNLFGYTEDECKNIINDIIEFNGQVIHFLLNELGVDEMITQPEVQNYIFLVELFSMPNSELRRDCLKFVNDPRLHDMISLMDHQGYPVDTVRRILNYSSRWNMD